jgi:hypothetical protein
MTLRNSCGNRLTSDLMRKSFLFPQLHSLRERIYEEREDREDGNDHVT